MTVNLIKTLLNHIPRYAEEEGDFYSVPRAELINALCAENICDRAIAENTVLLIENLLDTLAVLNADYLKKAEWCFISFPAQLLAMSVLTAMSDKNSRFFAENFWNTQGISNDKKDQQRNVLKELETRRLAFHEKAQPIRFIYVAWAIIKHQDQILLHLREDIKPRHDEKAGDYGLLGGRLNQRDMPVFSQDKNQSLRLLQSGQTEEIRPVLPETLKRELQEEAGLLFETHYRFKPWRSLKPHQQVEGAAPNHALTEYYFDIFQIELTLAGYLFLQQQLKTNSRLVWFSLAEIERGTTTDGKMAYLKALYNNYQNDRARLKTELQAMPDSFAAGYLFQPVNRNKYAVILPVSAENPLSAGEKGKEKSLETSLTPRQLALLLGLAAHNRGFEFSNAIENLIFHPFGWIEVQHNPALVAELNQLAELFKKSDFRLENQRDTLFRWSVPADVIYFAEQLFTYSVQQSDLESVKNKIPVKLARAAIPTALGLVTAQTEQFMISLNLAADLQKIMQQEHCADHEAAQKIEDNAKKFFAKERRFLALGLKALVRREAGMIKFCATYKVL